MRLAEAKVGDRVVLKGAVTNRYDFPPSYSAILLDGNLERQVNYVLHTAEVEIIERPWQVGDRLKYGSIRVPYTVLAVLGEHVWAIRDDETCPITIYVHEAERLPVEGVPA
jgi:hypothetical protein